MTNMYEIIDTILETGRCYIDLFEKEDTEKELKIAEIEYTCEEEPSGLYLIEVDEKFETQLGTVLENL